MPNLSSFRPAARFFVAAALLCGVFAAPFLLRAQQPAHHHHVYVVLLESAVGKIRRALAHRQSHRR